MKRKSWRKAQTVLAETSFAHSVARRLSRGPPAFELVVEVTKLGSRLRGSGALRFSFLFPHLLLLLIFCARVIFGKVLFAQHVAFENSRVATPTFWKRVGGFHENCLRMARYRLLEIKAVSASRVVFVARPFSKMLGTPKGRGIGSPFFAYFLLAKQRK
jgi:hypothetical protein